MLKKSATENAIAVTHKKAAGEYKGEGISLLRFELDTKNTLWRLVDVKVIIIHHNYLHLFPLDA